jgi:hypothetical protein
MTPVGVLPLGPAFRLINLVLFRLLASGRLATAVSSTAGHDTHERAIETTIVGNGVYKTRVKAESGMKSVKV